MKAMAKLKRRDSEESDEKEDQINEGQIFREISNCSKESTKALLKYCDARMRRYKMFECPIAAQTESGSRVASNCWKQCKDPMVLNLGINGEAERLAPCWKAVEGLQGTGGHHL
ncbi:hypothetical protein C5167_049211 [Papaver somniferum]|uniref:Uncharacterized protein n=1 Tax=Papaver somniferum TaxID=3469 RepID=A0A4Y7KMX3_PAPSO|nr:hypothetical protein C5167_049211 [Papaver somniferum]